MDIALHLDLEAMMARLACPQFTLLWLAQLPFIFHKLEMPMVIEALFDILVDINMLPFDVRSACTAYERR